MPIKPFYDVANFLYNSVMNSMPEFVQDRPMANAFILGSAGMYGIVRGLQWTSKNVMNKIIPEFDNKWLPKLEKMCIAGMAAAPVLYAVIDPEGAKEIMTHNFAYTPGMAGIYVGSITGAIQDLHNRKIKSLEEKL